MAMDLELELHRACSMAQMFFAQRYFCAASIQCGKEMIKIDWHALIYDHVWFGFYRLDSEQKNRGNWSRRPTLWADRLWPVRRYGETFPTWWCIVCRVPLLRDENGKLIND